MTATELAAGVLWVCSGITTVAAALVLFVKPIRERVLGAKKQAEGIKCLLRSEMLRTYYHHREDKQVRQFEYENFILAYKAYKAMKGNSFIDHIKSEVDEWEIVT